MNIVIFGAGKNGAKLLNEEKYNVIAFLDNDILKERDSFCGIKVISPYTLCSLSYDMLVIARPFHSTKDKQIIFEIVKRLLFCGVEQNKIYVYSENQQENLIKISDILEEKVVIDSYEQLYEQMYPKSIAITHRDYLFERCSQRRLYLYGVGYESLALTRYLSLIGINVEKYIDDETSETNINEIEIIKTLDLLYENDNNFFILVVNDKEDYSLSKKKLRDLSLIEDYDFSYYSEIPGTKEPFYYDVTLSYSRIRDKHEGMELFGDIDNPNAIKIFTLGGSTTESSLFFVRGWVQYLVDLFKNNNQSVVLYSGGVSGYTSTQELLKLQRDVIPLKPDIVISYSGVNDLYMYPKQDDKVRFKKPFITKFQAQFMTQILEKLRMYQYGLPTPDIPDWDIGGQDTVFYGLENDKSAVQYWIDNTRMMCALCKEFDIKFFSFLQPFRFNGYYETSMMQDIIHSRRDPSCYPSLQGEALYGKKEEVKKLQSKIKKYDYITDLSEIFYNHKNIYYDSVHVYEKGNQIIANSIYNKIVEKL